MKLATLVLVLVGSLCASLGVSNRASAQDPVYSTPGEAPVYASAPANNNGPRSHAHSPGGIKDLSVQRRPYSASGLLYIPWFHGIGIGVKLGFEIPVAPNGFIPSINDSISIEPAFSIAYTNYYDFSDVTTTNYVIAVGGLWSFWLRPDLRVYGALNLGANIYSYHWDQRFGVDVDDNDVDPYIEIAAGVSWKLQDKIALRGELGWYGPRGGIQFLF